MHYRLLKLVTILAAQMASADSGFDKEAIIVHTDTGKCVNFSKKKLYDITANNSALGNFSAWYGVSVLFERKRVK